MSPNLIANQQSDGADLQSLDILFAICMHAVIVAVILILALWHKPLDFHPQSVQVSMISAHQLDKMIKRAHKRPKRTVKHVKPKVSKPVHKTKKPSLKPAAKSAPQKDFDPFKPMESASDVTSSAPRLDSKAADVFAGQLSAQEINRYIALIQNAVQSHWKVPNVSKVQDPLVEMVLNPDGSVYKVSILESSGNTAFDASLLRAIEAAAPFQVPTKEFELFRDNRIRFRPLR